MEHKPFAVITPVAVAAILILGILSGISSTAAAQLSKTVKSPYISKTVKSPYISKTVKSPYISKTVKSPYISKMGATKTAYRTQGASNGKKRTELTISASPNGPDKIEGSVTWVPVILSGRLTSEGSGVAGAMILFSCGGESCYGDSAVTNPTAHYDAGLIHYATTDSGGHYSIGALSGHKEKVEAGFLGDQIANERLHLQSSKASTKVK